MLEDATSTLAAVVSDVRGLSAQELLQQLLGGETDARALAELAHHVFLLREQLAHRESLDVAIARGDAELAARLLDEREAIALLETIPGVARRTAEVVVASSPRLAPTGRASPRPSTWPRGPGSVRATPSVAADDESGRTRHGNAWVRRTLAEVATVASPMQGTSLAAQFRRLAARRGKRRAVVAVGHSVLVAISHLLTRHEPSHELGAQYVDERDRATVQRRLVHRLQRLGFAVTLETLPAPS